MRPAIVSLFAMSLMLPVTASAADAHNPRYEGDVYRARMDVATVGLVVSGLGLVGGAVGVVSNESTITDLLGIQGTLFLAGGATITAYGSLQARSYPLERRVTLAPAVASLSLAGLSGVGLLVWAGNSDPDLDEPLLYGTLGVAAASTGFAVVQVVANGGAWRERQRGREQARLRVGVVPTRRGGALVGTF